MSDVFRLYKGVRYSMTTLTLDIVFYPIVIDTIVRINLFVGINGGRRNVPGNFGLRDEKVPIPKIYIIRFATSTRK